MITPPSYHRRQKTLSDRMHGGTLLSFTTVRHPPAGFPDTPIRLGLVALDTGAQVIGQVQGEHPMIGDRVAPRMHLTRTTAEGLRIYEVAYESLVRIPAKDDFVFEGYILALTGPSGVGKSTVSKILVKALSDYVVPVPILTTRGAKDGDDGEYLYVSHQEFIALQDKGLLASATHIPSNTEDRMYGYRKEDITAIWKQKRIPVVVTEMHLLQGLSRTFGRRSILSCGLLPPGSSRRAMLSQLLHRLRARGRDTEENIADRVRNASADLDFFLQRKELFDHMLVNDDITAVVDALKGHVLRTQEEKA
ncbi:MAG: OB-fold domain-containing protein [Patescibacteria group bacterium]